MLASLAGSWKERIEAFQNGMNGFMRNPKDLKVFAKAKELSKAVYRLTLSFPSEEKFELVRQIRRAGSSVLFNLSEGCSRASQKDFARFVEIALGSAMELETQLDLAHDLIVEGVLQKQVAHVVGASESMEFAKTVRPVLEMTSEVVKMLIGLQEGIGQR